MDYREIKEFLIDSIKYVVLIIVLIAFVMYIATLQQVIGPSMSPKLKANDLLILNKLVYKLKDVKRGDVISFEYDDTKYLIKRVIGLPGETVMIKDNKLYINNKLYDEYYLNDDVITEDIEVTKVIPKNMYYVLGDNRGDSKDSREIGFIKKEDIIGKVFLRIWPITGFKLVK